ncbi:histidine kinase [Microbacterium sp. cx-55]|uniref:histidine kinase n=1 Tax=Microbacterium sp. cx-55 TaxID=2875948 RepID=UPI001CBB0B60|nr:histidine kinase [Microbacterium sp. cx-55]MBZ4488718.1 histidine kinase [Microbacterium sp. cx-55]UGB36044.1 histidine kinase [Microbacterium sp. cx-55]
MRYDLLSTLTGGLLILEGAAIAVLAIAQGGAIIGGDTSALESAIALLVLTVIGAAAVVAFGVATIRGRSWGRSGGIVTQLLILAVAGGAATGVFAHPLLGLQLAIPAIITLVLLFAAVRQAGRDAGTERP